MASESYQPIGVFECLYLGVQAPNDQQNPKFRVLFTTFVSMNREVFSPIQTSFLLKDNFALKVDVDIMSKLQPILSLGKLYRIVAAFDSYSIDRNHGIYYRLIDIQSIDLADSLLNPYIGEILPGVFLGAIRETLNVTIPVVVPNH